MTDDALMADANLAEIARLTTQVRDLYDVIKQMRAALASERRARTLAESDSAAYRRMIAVLARAGDLDTVRGVAGAALTTLRPGAALLAELEAARELKDWTRRWQRHNLVSLDMIRAMDAMDMAAQGGDA